MANIILKNGAGQPIEYKDVEAIEVPQADEQILAQTVIVGFAYSDEFGLYVLEIYPSPLSLEIGGKYTVVWDGTPYECTCQDLSAVQSGAIGVGNLADFGGTGNGEPFIMVALGGAALCASTDESESHTVAVLKKGGVQIFSAGSAGNDVRYVTFKNGDTTLYVKPVATGDDCVDVLAKGFIETPTKESTAQTDYTYSGWSLTNGGAASNVLGAVTENRTVYAAYTESVRRYTISYYDGDTLLKTESLPYGTTPSYSPAKNGYTFTGWTPEAAAVTGDASYYANWIEKYDFASLTWAQISEISESGEADKAFELGAKKTFSYKLGTSNYTGVAEIVGFNHDDRADGQGKAGITLRLNGCTDQLEGIQSGSSNKSWDECEARKYNPYHKIATDNYGVESALYNVIKPVTKKFYHWANGTMSTTTDGAFLPSMTELGYNMTHPEGEAYELFATKNKVLGAAYPELISKNNAGVARGYWTRTKSGNYHFHTISTAGASASTDQATSAKYARVYYACV